MEVDDTPSDYYFKGANDYWMGKSFLDNPYEQGTMEYNQWRDGWSDNRIFDEVQESESKRSER